MSKNVVIEVSDLTKSYGKNHVLKGVNFSVTKGQMLALLGPNGAGKTTTVRILSTLLRADSGSVSVHGHDVAKEAEAVRSVIGLTGQSAAVDELLTGRENLIMMGRLYRLTADNSKARAVELLEEFDLVDAADRPVKTYSGGMRRRLDLAVSLIATPPVIFLDEPTTGLDPRSRLVMWDIINKLKQDGATILLTTQYLEEADQLADNIILIDDGVVAAEGTAKQLKAKVGKDRLILTLKNSAAMKKVEKTFGVEATYRLDLLQATFMISGDGSDVKKVLDKVSKQNIAIASMDIYKPTLDDVFLSLTNRDAKKEAN